MAAKLTRPELDAIVDISPAAAGQPTEFFLSALVQRIAEGNLTINDFTTAVTNAEVLLRRTLLTDLTQARAQTQDERDRVEKTIAFEETAAVRGLLDAADAPALTALQSGLKAKISGLQQTYQTLTDRAKTLNPQILGLEGDLKLGRQMQDAQARMKDAGKDLLISGPVIQAILSLGSQVEKIQSGKAADGVAQRVEDVLGEGATLIAAGSTRIHDISPLSPADKRVTILPAPTPRLTPAAKTPTASEGLGIKEILASAGIDTGELKFYEYARLRETLPGLAQRMFGQEQPTPDDLRDTLNFLLTMPDEVTAEHIGGKKVIGKVHELALQTSRSKLPTLAETPSFPLQLPREPEVDLKPPITAARVRESTFEVKSDDALAKLFTFDSKGQVWKAATLGDLTAEVLGTSRHITRSEKRARERQRDEVYVQLGKQIEGLKTAMQRHRIHTVADLLSSDEIHLPEEMELFLTDLDQELPTGERVDPYDVLGRLPQFVNLPKSGSRPRTRKDLLFWLRQKNQ